MHIIERHIENHADRLLNQFPCVVILGARQVGKTTLSRSLRPDWRYFDLENPNDYDLISHDPVYFFEQNPGQIILDEAQRYPELFNVLRGVIDNDRSRANRFILTGSSSPALNKHLSESLAGRVSHIEVGTLTPTEQQGRPLSAFYELFHATLSRSEIAQYVQENACLPISKESFQQSWLIGGYPDIVTAQESSFRQQWMSSYRDAYIHRDIKQLFPRINDIVFQRFIGMLANLSGTIINKSDLARSLEVSEKTVREYLSIADGTFLWRTLLSYEKTSMRSIVKRPKGYIRDTGLLHYLLKIDSLEKLHSHPILGFSFEGFVTELLMKNLHAAGIADVDAYYYRTRQGNEVDLVLEGFFGVLPVEIKHGVHTKISQLRSLSKFIEANACPFGLLLNQSDTPAWVTKNILQLPVTWL